MVDSLLRSPIKKIQEEGLASFFKTAYRRLKRRISNYFCKISVPILNTITSRRPIGTNIFDRDWDVLIVLDACRADMIPEITDSLPSYEDSETIWSVGSVSAEWMVKNFNKNHQETISNTAYLSSNPWSHRIFSGHLCGRNINRGFPDWDAVSDKDFKHFEVIPPSEPGSETMNPSSDILFRIQRPQILTDRAIAVGREKDFDRLIVHYMLPHLPFYGDAMDWNPDNPSTENLMSGPEQTRELHPHEKGHKPARTRKVSIKDFKESYSSNLQLVMAYVNILLENIDAEKVVITADHGEGLGEYGIWGHVWGWPFTPLKTVPWVTTTATDKKTYESKHGPQRQPTFDEISEHLKELGYIT